MIRLVISGAAGKMGLRIIDLASKDKDCEVVLALERPDHPGVNKTTCTTGINITDDLGYIKDADVLIEFTSPEATVEHLEFALKLKKAFVIGTTGLDEAQVKKIKDASSQIPIIYSPNMSIGVNVLFKLVEEASKRLGNRYCINIIEAHHVYKKDAPSGTAKKIVEIIEGESCKVNDVKSIREGEIIGDHKVIFDGPFDRIELMHSAKSRDIFAQGAIVAAKWLVGKKPGLYNMHDVIGK
ncbi:MAG: 4-hydroxy-tetrahydrodipicolinate reductase [Candidatus Omnitrophota bacterium]